LQPAGNEAENLETEREREREREREMRNERDDGGRDGLRIL